MNPKALIIITVLMAVSVVSVPSPVLAQDRGQVVKAAPIFVVPDATRTPLTVAAEGTVLTVLSVVLSVGKEWLEVEWQDPTWGRRVGYIRAEFVKLDRKPASEQKNVPIPPTPPTPTKPTPPQVTPPKPVTPGGKPPSQPTTAKKPVSTAGRWTDRGYVNVNGIYQGGSKIFSESFTFDQYAEVAHVTTEYPRMDGPAFDAGVGLRVWRNLAAGVAVSRFTKSGTAAVSATIPHPLYLNRDRTITGSFSSSRTDTAIHVQAAWVIPAGKKVLVTITGGPSFFSVKQSVVNGVRWSEAYPYDTAEFSGADGEGIAKSVIGYNVGGDVGFFFSKTVGVGGMIRYRRAQVPLGSKSGNLTVDAGAFQAGGGLRIRLPRPAPKKPVSKPAAPTPPKR